MAAYAALVSLTNTIDHIQDHPRISNCFDKKQMESLSLLISFLLDFVEITHSHIGLLCKEEEDELLEREITSAAYVAEDVIESHVVDQIHFGSISLLDLQTVVQGMVSVKDKVAIVKEEGRFKDDLQQAGPTYPMFAPSTSSKPSIEKSRMVGFDEEFIQLLDALTGRQSTLQVIPIVGMGGIGKTTIARNIYENRLILHHFDICAWVTISQEYSMKGIFSKLLSCQSNQSANQLGRETEQQLAQRLYQSLIGRRYLIILDDIWSIEVWENMMFFFPDNNNGSRIILTTRLSSVAVHFGPSYFSLKFLDEDKSWELFCEKAFLEEGCPRELEEIGKKIVKKCKGLPLLIAAIGGLVRKSSRTQELWENISKDINLIRNISEERQNLDILSLSYSHLPVHLKPCFLYMGVFPEDHEIRVSHLIKLWVAEGFIKPNKTQSLEEIAEYYLNDLFDRNLLLVGRLRKNGKIKTCTIHDLLRELCIKVAQKEKFIHVIRSCDGTLCINKERRFFFDGNFTEVNCDPLLCHTLETASLTRSLLGEGGKRLPFSFRLLRVFNVVDSDSSLHDILKHVNLRYFVGLVHISLKAVPSSISLLWNVQTLRIRDYEQYVAPTEIWSMPQLRHLEFRGGIYLPDPLLRNQKKNGRIVLKNLQTLRVVNLELSEETCKRIPNVKILKISYEGLSKSSCYNNLYNIGRLRKLESLHCHFIDLSVLENTWGNLVRNLTFPTSLQRLTLRGRDVLYWDELTTIGSLPNLEVLKFDFFSVRGVVWDPIEGEFLRLKYLEMNHLLHLQYWNAESFHFPVLEKLVLHGIFELEEIPLGIGEIPTLRVIEVRHCTESAAISAMRILEDQETQGNDNLLVRIQFFEKAYLERFKEKVADFESFNSNNLQLGYT